ncbi:hypothetical protein [Myceligenerans crystallogenes]
MTTFTPIQPGDLLPDDESLLALAEFLHHGVRPRMRSLWFALLGPRRRLLPVIAQFEELPAEPGVPFVAQLGRIWADAAPPAPAPPASIVLMLERPGAEAVQDSDRVWRAALHAAAAESGIEVAGFFLATADGVRPLTPDDARPRRGR